MSYTIENSILKFDEEFNEPLDDYMKIMSNPNINEIYFDQDFNQEIDHKIPFNIKIIRFHNCSDFNKDVNFLPESIEKIYYGYSKNHSIEELTNLPRNLTSLKLGGLFNQEIKPGILLENLNCLTFGWYFNQELKPDILPKKLISLTFGGCFNQEIKPGILPENLISLTFDWHFNQEIKPGVLPENLNSLTFGCNFNQEIKPSILPKNLTSLTFGSGFNQEIKPEILPKSLKVLELHNKEQKNTILKNIDLFKKTFEIKYY